jgi:phosphohistidine phosphatase
MKAMKHLILLRHASARPDGVDRERPLSAAGRLEAERSGRALAALAARGFRPERALASPALRVRETLSGVRLKLASVAVVEEDEALYLAGPGRLLERLRGVAEPAAQLLLVGHNPGLSELVEWLARESAPRGLAPAAFAALRIRRERWCELEPGCAELVALRQPDAAP